MQRLEQENHELKKALALFMNRPLIKKISEAIERVNSGEYLTEEEFFKDSPQ